MKYFDEAAIHHLQAFKTGPPAIEMIDISKDAYTRIVGDGRFAELIKSQFQLYCKKYKLNETQMTWNVDAFRRVRNNQLPLF